MHYRRLGHSGLKVSEISLGSWVTFGNQLDESAAIALIKEAFSQGINFFDNADMYSNGVAETVMGKAVKALPRQEAGHFQQGLLAHHERPQTAADSRGKHITESIHASLKRPRHGLS